MKREFRGWWFMVLGLLVISVLIFTALGGAGRVAGVFVDRKVFEHSYQRSEGLAAQIGVLEAQLAEIQAQLSQPLDEGTRQQLEVQLVAIRAQLKAAEGRSR